MMPRVSDRCDGVGEPELPGERESVLYTTSYSPDAAPLQHHHTCQDINYLTSLHNNSHMVGYPPLAASRVVVSPSAAPSASSIYFHLT